MFYNVLHIGAVGDLEVGIFNYRYTSLDELTFNLPPQPYCSNMLLSADAVYLPEFQYEGLKEFLFF
jgi:hypothetical protein